MVGTAGFLYFKGYGGGAFGPLPTSPVTPRTCALPAPSNGATPSAEPSSLAENPVEHPEVREVVVH